MASLYKRDRSPYFWIEYIDASGERRQESTRLRYRVTAQARQAQQLRNDLTTREIAGRLPDGDGAETWQAWVPRLIAQRYGNAASTLTRQRCEIAWRNIEAFLRDKEIAVPRQLSRQQVRDFIEWRQVRHQECGVHKAAKNTALLEIKFLGVLMHEAMQSGFCATNPCSRLGLKRDEPKRKPEIKPAEHRLITRELKIEPEWMRISYQIAWEQGCRFSETCLPLPDVDLSRNVLALRTKGKKQHVAEVPLNPRLRPLFRRLKREGRKFTFEKPPMPGKTWWAFFQRIGLPHLSFHCTRISFITRCYRAGLPEATVMRLVLHASTTVHRIYPRLDSGRDLLQEIRKVA
jgi:integrase